MASEIEVHVKNIEIERGGNLVIMLFGEEGFPKKHAHALYSQKAVHLNNEMKFRFTVTEPEIAVKVHHDEDDNGKVTKNWTGIYPREGLGFSNGQKVSLTGAPKYKYSKLTVEPSGLSIEISMIYP